MIADGDAFLDAFCHDDLLSAVTATNKGRIANRNTAQCNEF